MTIEKFSATLLARLSETLSTINLKSDSLAKLGAAYSMVHSLVVELANFVKDYKFVSEEEEIRFFKTIQPQVFNQYFFLQDVLELRIKNSFTTPQRKSYTLSRRLETIEKFVTRHQKLYTYYLTGQADLDQQYFTIRALDTLSLKSDINPYITLGRILGYQQLRDYLVKDLDALQPSANALTWTASKADLTELVYALHSTRVIDTGNADIKTIMTQFETLFNIDLHGYYRTFQDIRARKFGRTTFIDKLKLALEQRLESMDR